jgi:hypothetical protein
LWELELELELNAPNGRATRQTVLRGGGRWVSRRMKLGGPMANGFSVYGMDSCVPRR